MPTQPELPRDNPTPDTYCPQCGMRADLIIGRYLKVELFVPLRRREARQGYFRPKVFRCSQCRHVFAEEIPLVEPSLVASVG